MKANCQIETAEQLAEAVARSFMDETGKRISYKADSCHLSKNGDFHFVYRDETGTFSGHQIFTANQLAYIKDMPLWEVVGVDMGGFDELAILFYEEV